MQANLSNKQLSVLFTTVNILIYHQNDGQELKLFLFSFEVMIMLELLQIYLTNYIANLNKRTLRQTKKKISLVISVQDLIYEKTRLWKWVPELSRKIEQ